MSSTVNTSWSIDLRRPTWTDPYVVYVLYRKYDAFKIKAVFCDKDRAYQEMRRLNALSEKKAARPNVSIDDCDFYGVRKYRLK